MTTEETHPQRRSLYAEREPLPPRSFGRYQPIAVLGYGGMATVYLASALGPANFTKLVVVKVFIFDMGHLQAIYRVLAFFLFGLLLMFAAFIYLKFWADSPERK